MDQEETDFLEADTIIQLGTLPRRMDLLTSLSGVDFEPCYAARDVVDIDGVPIHFINLESSRRNQRAKGRAQDLVDIENLE